MAGVYMDKQVSGKVKILTGGNGTTGIHNGPIPKPATREYAADLVRLQGQRYSPDGRNGAQHECILS